MEHYFISEYPITKPTETQLPILFLGEDVCLEQVAFARHLLRGNHSQATIRKATSAIGMFWSYLQKTNAEITPKLLPLHFENFVEARIFGDKELGWKPVQSTTANMDAEYVSRFFDFCSAMFGTPPLNPREEYTPTWGQRMGELHNRCNTDLLNHLKKSTLRMRRRFRFKNPDGGGNRSSCYPTPQQVRNMLTYSKLRDRMLWFLLAYGGIRVSEALNLYVTDILLEPDGNCKILLKHPSVGRDTRYVNGRDTMITRKEFLGQYGMTPRNLLAQNHPLHSGWKGMMFDNQAERYAIVHWLVPSLGKEFVKMHMEYMHYRVKAGNKHPYYFISLKGNDFGNPLKMGNVRLQFSKLCKKLDIPSHNGANHIHSLRHFYKWASTSIGGISLLDQRIRMHHKSIDTTANYGTPTLEEMQLRLADAYAKMEEVL